MKKKADRNVQNEPAYRLSHLSWVGQMLLILRWLALLLVTVLSLFDYLDEGVLVSP
ncbi:MAG: hypothetical protein GYA30_07995, partial [Chloroflexi bacterium]|nr:hypothetical protein [Chloroflexota bacterium]